MAYHDPDTPGATDYASQVQGTIAELQILAQRHPEILSDPSIVAAEHDPSQLATALAGWEHRNGMDPNSVYDDKGTLQNGSFFSDNLPWITALMGGALVAPAALGALGIGGGGAGAAGAAEGGLDALGPTTAGSMAATAAAGAVPAGIAAGGAGGAAAGGGILANLASPKGIAALGSVLGPALGEAFAQKPQTYNSFAGGPNDPGVAQSNLTSKLNDVFGRLSSRDISLPDANLSRPTASFSGGALPFPINIKPTSAGTFGNPGGAKPSGLGGLTGSTSDPGGLTPPGPSVSRVAAPGAPPGPSMASPDDYASAHQALQLLKGGRSGNI